MSDLISRQAAIEAIVKEANQDGAYGYVDTKSAVKILMSIPSEREDMYVKFREWLSAEADDVWEYYAEADGGELTQRAKEDCKEMLLYGYTKGKNERESGVWIPVKKVYRTNDVDFPNTHIEWETATYPDDVDAVRCSKCGEVFDFADARNWCTECGAKMRGGEDE